MSDYNVGHATSQPVADDVVLHDATIYTDPPYVTGEPDLNTNEIEQFKTLGFVVKRGLIADAALFREVVDHVWRNVPRGLLRRDDPATWLEAPGAAWTDDDAVAVGRLMQGNWKMRSRDGIGTEPFLVDRIANHPSMLALAQRFMGGPVRPARRVRGIYSIFPHPPDAPGRYGPHADYMAAHVSAMVIADAVPPRSGGFTVWPGSHLRLHPHWDTVHGGIISDDRAEGFRLARDAVLREITPVEFTGDAGAVIFWHPRLLHSAGINQSAARGAPLVRVIVPCDYQRASRAVFDDVDYGPGPEYQWWVDTRNYVDDAPSTEDNVWHDWGI